MGKRQTRIFQPEIRSKTSLLTNRKANVILTDQTAHHGTILALTDSSLTLRDMRLKKHTIALHQISEIILDTTTAW